MHFVKLSSGRQITEPPYTTTSLLTAFYTPVAVQHEKNEAREPFP